MNKKIKQLLSTLLVVSILLFQFSPITAKAQVSTVIKSQQIVSQIDTKFPEDNATNREYAKYRRLFKAYKGRGSMIVENHGAASAEVYINGRKYDISSALKSGVSEYHYDIGKYTVNGDNTLKVLNVKPKGAYINISIPYPTLVEGKPEEVGISSEKLNKVDELINKDVENGFPGAVLVVIKDGKIIKNTAYGYKKIYDGNTIISNPEKMNTNTMFDLASNTKMYATTMALQKLVSEGKLDVNEYVKKYIPGFTGEGRENIKVRDIATHSAGFSSSIKFYDDKKGGSFYSHDREKTIKLLEKAPIDYPTGTKTIYSDTDFMLLGCIIENITGQKLDEYVEENIYKPLGLSRTMFNPLRKGMSKSDCAATEIHGNTRDGARNYPEIRNYTLQGEVHDEKSYYAMDGVSGHAGLFSTGSDIAVLAQMMLNGGGYGNYKLCDGKVIDEFAKPSNVSNGYGLGWERASYGNKIYQFGPYANNYTIGHTGWTGTLVTIDFKNDMAVILLTNKKHSKVVNPAKDDNTFVGDNFETGKYGSVESLVYEALLESQIDIQETENENAKLKDSMSEVLNILNK